MNIKLWLLPIVMAVASCAAPSPEFAWYHPQGGEYLFEFDSNECHQQVVSQGLALGSDTDGPYFSCMERRGYSLLQEVTLTTETAPSTVAGGAR